MQKVIKYRVTDMRRSSDKAKIFSCEEFAKEWPDVASVMYLEDITSMRKKVDIFGGVDFLFEQIEQSLSTCQSCGAVSIVEVCAKTSDMCVMKHLHREYDGYVLRDMGVGEGDYIEFDFCTRCGQIQGEFPKPIHGAIVTKDTEGYPYE